LRAGPAVRQAPKLYFSPDISGKRKRHILTKPHKHMFSYSIAVQPAWRAAEALGVLDQKAVCSVQKCCTGRDPAA
jgi:hypothetical protein